MARKPSVIVNLADKKVQIAALKHTLKNATRRMRDHDREAKRIERETSKLLKDIARKRAEAQRAAEAIEDKLNAYTA